MLNMCLSYVYQKNVKNMLSLNNYVFNIKKTRLMYPGIYIWTFVQHMFNTCGPKHMFNVLIFFLCRSHEWPTKLIICCVMEF